MSDIIKFVNLFLALLSATCLHAYLLSLDKSSKSLVLEYRHYRKEFNYKLLAPFIVLMTHMSIFYIAWSFKFLGLLHTTENFFEYWSSLLRMQELLTLIGVFIVFTEPGRDLWRQLWKWIKFS